MTVHENTDVFSKVCDILPAGTEVDVVEVVDGWAKLSDGHFIMKNFLEVK